MIKNGKYFFPPPQDDKDFKELFASAAAAGVGLPVDDEGFPDGQWTPDRLAAAISQIEANQSGIDLRTVQHWFENNDKGISVENIRWLARIFGCNDPDASAAWQMRLRAANSVLAKKRKEGRAVAQNSARKTTEGPVPQPSGIAFSCEALFSTPSPLNLPASVWAGCIALGFLAYITGVHNVTYSPIPGLEKQVGLFWAPNWTVLELIILPVFLILVSDLLSYWKSEGRTAVSGSTPPPHTWQEEVAAFTLSHAANLFVCFGLVFLAQWSGVHLQALTTGNLNGLMVDWNLVAVLRPEIISRPEAIALSMLAFLYTAAICCLFLCGLILICTVNHDLARLEEADRLLASEYKRVAAVCLRLYHGVYRCAVLGIMIASCIKLQAVYLTSDAPTIIAWITKDIAIVFGGEPNGWLEQQALAHFTSFLLLFATCSVLFYSWLQIYWISVRWNENEETMERLPWIQSSALIVLMVGSFGLLGLVPGSSTVFFAAVGVSTYSLFNPNFSWPKRKQFKQSAQRDRK